MISVNSCLGHYCVVCILSMLWSHMTELLQSWYNNTGSSTLQMQFSLVSQSLLQVGARGEMTCPPKNFTYTPAQMFQGKVKKIAIARRMAQKNVFKMGIFLRFCFLGNLHIDWLEATADFRPGDKYDLV